MSPKLPLRGVRLLEFGFLIAGPLGPRFLAEFGAEVIKVESVRRPDGYRPGGAFSSTSPHSYSNRLRSFNEFNRNKLGISVNLTTPEGREVMYRLIRISDVVVENFSYGVMQRWGLDYQSLKQIRPDIIVVDLQGMGQTGPRRSHVTWGPSIMAFSGMTHLWTHPEAPEPVGSQSAHPDYVTGSHCAFVIMAALHYRNRTGKGQHIDQGQIETTAALLGPAYLDAIVNGRTQRPLGNRSPFFAPYNCYPCSGEDRWCVIAITSEEEWRRFCAVLGDPAWTKDPRFQDMLCRLRNVDALDEQVAAWTRQHTPHEVMELLQRAGVPVAAVQNGKDLNEDPHLLDRGFIIRLDHPEMVGRAVRYPGLPIRLSKTPAQIHRRAPDLGQDNEYVFGELLGMSLAERTRLAEAGILV